MERKLLVGCLMHCRCSTNNSKHWNTVNHMQFTPTGALHSLRCPGRYTITFTGGYEVSSLVWERRGDAERLVNLPKVTEWWPEVALQNPHGGSVKPRLLALCGLSLMGDHSVEFSLCTSQWLSPALLALCSGLPFWDEEMETPVSFKPYPTLCPHKSWSWDSNPSLSDPQTDTLFTAYPMANAAIILAHFQSD